MRSQEKYVADTYRIHIAPDGPRTDPLTYAAKCAARRFVMGQQMDVRDWEALEAMASSELREIDLKTDF